MAWIYIVLILITSYLAYTYYVGQWSASTITGYAKAVTGPRLTILITGTPATSMDVLFSNITVASNSTTYLDSNYTMRNGIPMVTITGDSFSVTINNASGALTGAKVAFADVTGSAATSNVSLSDSKAYTYQLANGKVVSS